MENIYCDQGEHTSPMIKDWMAELAAHYEKTRRRYPQDQLLILFDIDGTILDMRYMVWRLLQIYDRNHNTNFFQDLTISDIMVHEDQIMPLLEKKVRPTEWQKVLNWYEARAWSSAAILEAHRPFRGVLEVIRWFQIQPNTHVGLNTARLEFMRADTLRSLNKLGQEYKVHFADELLYLRPDDWEQSAPQAKAAGVRHFEQAGYRVFAFVDNEPENLEAVSDADPHQEILLLHADTIFQSKRNQLPPRTVGGTAYDLTELISEHALPQHIQFVWRGVNEVANMDQFLASEVHWGQFDVQPNPIDLDLILYLETLVPDSAPKKKVWHTLDDALARMARSGKGIKLNLNVNGPLVGQVLEIVRAHHVDDSRLWFSGNFSFQKSEFRQLALAYPRAIIECPVDFLAPLVYSTPAQAREILDTFTNWGVNRFSIGWHTPNLRPFFDQMDRWGFDVNIYNVPDLESFLQAVLLLPCSITSDFNFPKWRYYGRGPGKNGRHQKAPAEIGELVNSY
jgi:hypothetical protein